MSAKSGKSERTTNKRGRATTPSRIRSIETFSLPKSLFFVSCDVTTFPLQRTSALPTMESGRAEGSLDAYHASVYTPPVR